MPRSTKAYLVPLLLLFLHVHISAAGQFGLPIREFNFNTAIRSFRHIYKPLNFLQQPQQYSNNPTGLHLLSVAAPPPPENFDGLSTVKAYLTSFGYFPDSDDFTDLLDAQAISSLQEYQQFFNLQVTGFPDNATIAHMSLPRCGVPDKNITYDLSPDHNVSWPLGTQWFPNGSRNLTYGFAPENELPKNVMKVFEDSFKRWSDAIGVVNLTETTSYDTANIKIGFYIFESGTIWEQVVGASFIKLESVNNNNNNNSVVTNVTSGYMVLVYDKSWVLPGDDISWENGDTDLETVVMHQIGHLLGLQHSSHEDSVMYPAILPSMQRKVNLSENDKEQINQVYFSAAISDVILPFGLLTTSFSLGFACILLFT